MKTDAPRPSTGHAPVHLTPWMVRLFAFCCGAIVANLYYAQSIIELIAKDVGLSTQAASLIVSLTQIGYALGMLLLVPLADLLENRRLMLVTAAMAVLSLAAAACTSQGGIFLGLSLLLGFSSVSVQILIPLAAHMTPEANRGRVVGSIMGGLLLGILLARPLASVIADHFGWRAVFGSAAVVMVFISLVMALTMPRRQPDHKASYGALLLSLGTLLRQLPVLRQRAFYQAMMFAAFSLFWTAAPLELSQRYGFSQSAIAVFALIGALGAIAAPIAGRLADAGHTRAATFGALAAAVLCFLPVVLHPAWGVPALVLTGVLLDFCVQMTMVTGQRAIYALDAASRGRLNALYMTSIFLGGSLGSALAGPLYSHGGWVWVGCAGSGFVGLALLRFLWSLRQA